MGTSLRRRVPGNDTQSRESLRGLFSEKPPRAHPAPLAL